MSQNFKEKKHIYLDHPVLFGLGCLVVYYFLFYFFIFQICSFSVSFSTEALNSYLAAGWVQVAAFTLGFKAVMGKEYVIGFTGKKLAKCLILGWIFIPISLYNLSIGAENPSWYLYLSVTAVQNALVSGASTAMAEEVLCRGVIAGNMIRVWGSKPKGLYAVMLVSSLMFGSMHALYMTEVGFSAGIFWQIANTFAMGLVFAAMYMRTRNILGVALVHGLVDFAGFLGRAGYERPDMALAKLSNSVAAAAILSDCVNIVICVAVAFYLVRPAKQAEIKALWNLGCRNKKEMKKNDADVSVLPQTARA